MNDLEFVQKCIKGDKPSWDEFVDKYSRLIYSYIHGILKLKGLNQSFKEHINDIFQEIFVLLSKDKFKKLKSFKAKNGCSLASWLRPVTINYTIDYLRKLKSTVSLDEEDENEFSLKEILASNSPPLTDKLIQDEKLVYLKDCIEELSRDDKYFLELHINRDLTLEELKDHFRVSRGVIDMHKARIIERLRQCFKDKGFLLDS